MVDGDAKWGEWINSEDPESEEYKNKNLQLDFNFSKEKLYPKDFLRLDHPEISTPPPPYFSIFS